MSMKNSCNTVGNRTRDHQACNVVPHPTACPETGLVKGKFHSTSAQESPDREQTYSPSLIINSTIDGDGW